MKRKFKEKPAILIVDDERTIRKLLSAFLKKKGYSAKAVSDREAMFREMAKCPYDIVLLDIRLPGSSGLRLLREIKKVDPYLEVIVITGYATVESVIEALRGGAYDYVSKPFRLDELKIVIDRCFEKQKLAGENVELKEIVALFEVSKLLTAEVGLDRLLNQILLSALQITIAKRGSILILDQEKKELTIKASRGLSNGVIKRTRIKIGEGIAGMVAEKGKPLLIADIDKVKKFKKSKRTKYETKSFISVPLVSFPLKVHGKVMGVLNLSDKISGEAFTERDLRIISILAGQAAAAIENSQLFELLRESYMGTVQALVKALEAKDKVTRDHSERVAQFAISIAEEMGLPPVEIEGLQMAAFLHDIGKLGIDIEVLAKPDKLTEKEWSIVRKHPLASAKIIEGISFIWDIMPLVRHHHERVDGKGFPGGLKGNKIPLGARILAVADAFEAMTAGRPYKKAYSRRRAMKELKILIGKRYDRRVVGAIESAVKKRLI